MRKYLASLVFVASAVIVSPSYAASPVNEATVEPGPTGAVQQVRVGVPGLRDEAAMVLVGTALIGLAAALRRAA